MELGYPSITCLRFHTCLIVQRNHSESLLIFVEVMSSVFKMGSHVFAGPTQILSDNNGSSNPHDVLHSLESALKGRLPLKGETATVDKNTFDFKEYRKATKHLLCGLVNCISNVWPEFSVAATVPPDRKSVV